MIIKTNNSKKGNSGAQKQQSKKTKSINALRKDYKDMKACRAQTLEFPITKMTYGFVNSHELKYIITPEGRIDFSGWIECILYMLYTIVKFYPDEYENLLRLNNVTGSEFIVDRTFGTIKLDGKAQRRVFKLYDTDLYVESRFEPAEIFNAMAGLIKIYSGDYSNVLLGIEDKNMVDRKIDDDRLGEFKECTIESVFDALQDGFVITEFEILNEKIKISELDGVLYIFCKWVYDNLGDGGIKKLPKNKYAGVVNAINRDDVDYNSLNKTDYYIYTNHDNRDIINFIRKSVEALGIDKTKLKLTVRKYRKVGD